MSHPISAHEALSHLRQYFPSKQGWNVKVECTIADYSWDQERPTVTRFIASAWVDGGDHIYQSCDSLAAAVDAVCTGRMPAPENSGADVFFATVAA